MKKGFFDTIIIALILMIGFKLLFPDAFTFSVIVNNNMDSSSDSTTPDDEFANLVEFKTLDEVYECFGIDSINGVYGSSDDGNLLCWETFYLTIPETDIIFNDAENLRMSLHLAGEPLFKFDGYIWYEYDIPSAYLDRVYNGFSVSPDCNYIISSIYI